MKLNHLIRIEECVEGIAAVTDTDTEEIIDALIGLAWDDEDAGIIRRFMIDALADDSADDQTEGPDERGSSNPVKTHPMNDPVKSSEGAEAGSSPSPDSALEEALQKEIERCQELLTQYAALGPAGNFAVMMIRRDIAAALKAMMEGDFAAMLRAYKALKGCE